MNDLSPNEGCRLRREISFDQLHNEVCQIRKDIQELKQLFLEKNQQPPEESNRWMGMDELVAYDPAKRSKATWYSKVSRNEVPYHKNGKNLVFLKSEIDDWLKSGRRKTNAEIQDEAHTYLKKKGGHND